MPQAVVHELEPVEVEQKHGEGLGAPRRSRERVLESVAEDGSVRQPGQRVEEGAPLELRLQARPLGHVTRVHHEPPDARVVEEVAHDRVDIAVRAVRVADPEPAGHGRAGLGRRVGQDAFQERTVLRHDKLLEPRADEGIGGDPHERLGGRALVQDPPVGVHDRDEVRCVMHKRSELRRASRAGAPHQHAHPDRDDRPEHTQPDRDRHEAAHGRLALERHLADRVVRDARDQTPPDSQIEDLVLELRARGVHQHQRVADIDELLDDLLLQLELGDHCRVVDRLYRDLLVGASDRDDLAAVQERLGVCAELGGVVGRVGLIALDDEHDVFHVALGERPLPRRDVHDQRRVPLVSDRVRGVPGDPCDHREVRRDDPAEPALAPKAPEESGSPTHRPPHR